jgi:DNA transposition AAA+ family ATPase
MGWQTAQISNYKKIWGVCKVAQSQSSAKIISFDSGFGKTYTLTEYAKNNENVFYMQCDRHFTKKVFLQKFAKSLGLQVAVGPTAEMIDEIIERLKTLKSPLIIWDEYDKVLEKSGVFDLFKTFYDNTLSFCGFVLCGTTALENTLKKCVAKNKIGYVELYSRCGREFINLKHLNQSDIIAICFANGIEDGETIKNIKIRLDEGDLRRLKSIIEHYKLKMQL